MITGDISISSVPARIHLEEQKRGRKKGDEKTEWESSRVGKWRKIGGREKIKVQKEVSRMETWEEEEWKKQRRREVEERGVEACEWWLIMTKHYAAGCKWSHSSGDLLLCLLFIQRCFLSTQSFIT